MNKWLVVFMMLLPYLGFSQKLEDSEFLKSKRKYQKHLDKHSHYTESGKHKLHYLQWGNPNDPTIVWLHGSFTNALEIEPFAKKITKLKYNLIAIDYYGHGKTPIPKGNFSANDLLDDIKVLLDSLQVQNCIIGGFSRGAYLTTMMYDKYPHLINALILEDGGVSPFLEHYKTLSPAELKVNIEKELQNRPQELFTEYDTEKDAYSAIKPYGETNKKQLYKNFASIRTLEDNYIIYKDIDKLFGMNSFENISLLLDGKLFTNKFANDLMPVPYFEIIQKATIPTLLLEAVAHEDPFPQSDYYLKLKSNNKNITHKTFDRSHHNIHFDQPKDFMQSIIEFLKHIKE